MPSLVTSIKLRLKQNTESYCFNSVLKKWATMRMMTQIMIINFFILLLIFTVTLGALLINLNQIVQSLNLDINSMLTQQTTKVQNMLIQRYIYMNVNLFQQTSSALTKTNLIYQIEQQYYNIDITYICPNITTRPIGSSGNLCISPQTAQDYQSYDRTAQTDTIMNFTGLLNTILFEYDLTQQFSLNSFYYTFNTSDQFFGAWPAHPLLQYFKPLTRPWYLQHENQLLQQPKKSQFYSDIYVNAQLLNKSPILGITLTQSLYKDGKVFGVAAHDINLKQIMTLLPNPSNMNLMLIYNNGTILFQNTYLNLTLNNSLPFQDSHITGFTLPLWEQLGQKNDQQICFYNEIFQKEIILNIHKFHSMPFYLVLFSNLDTIDLEEEIANGMIENITYEFFITMSLVWSLFLCIQVICYLLIQSITKPIRDIQTLIEPGKSDNKKNIFLRKISQTSSPSSDNTIQQLFNCVNSRNEQLEKTSFIKSQECLMIERFVFNTQVQTKIYITEEIDFLQDFNEVPENYSQQIKFMLRNIVATRYL